MNAQVAEPNFGGLRVVPLVGEQLGTMTRCVPKGVFLLAAVLLIAIGPHRARGQEPVRSFSMGMAYWPPLGASTPPSVIRADLGELLPNTDAILVQVPWCPGSMLPEAEWMSSVAHESGKQLVLAIDWLTGDRDEVRCSNPTSWAFSSGETATAFKEAVTRLAARYHPQYLLLGVEVDYYAVIAPDDFSHFLAAYRSAYDEIGRISPDTKVGVSLQYEHMRMTPGRRGTFVDEMVTTFEGISDFIGLATYPFIAGVGAAELDASYFQAVENLSVPLAVMETGWPAADADLLGVEAGLFGYRSQARYLRELLVALHDLDPSMVIWASMRDVGVSHVDDGAPSWAAFIGLWDSGGNPKPALTVWRSWFRRPQAAEERQ